MWKNIRKGAESFFGHVLYVAEEGLRIQFWYDLWCGHIPLKDLYPDLFSRAIGKEAWISELISISPDGGSKSRNIQFHRAPKMVVVGVKIFNSTRLLMIGRRRECFLFTSLFIPKYLGERGLIVCFGS